ncbi:MAG: hypothetical protein R6X25_03660 [Candidatus Krumholzibacteriia bacterium]
MKDVQKKLLAVSAKLSSLANQVEKMIEALEAEKAQATPVKKSPAPRKAKTPANKTRAAKKASRAKTAPSKKAIKPVTAEAQAKAPAAPDSPTMLDNIFGMISRSRSGITVEKLKKRTGLEARQVSNALYKLTKKGKIEALSRGVYGKKKA